MSYSRRYSESVSYSDSDSWRCSCGSSGSVRISGEVPINICINVDTNSFDNSVNGFNNSANALTGSVVAMNAAQCAAINKTATDISTAMIKGFFTVVGSELSQQMKALHSAMEAGLAKLVAQGKDVDKIKNVMERDYSRISSRYIEIFNNLDDECRRRIYALDKQSFSLSENVQKKLLNESICNTAAMNLLGIEEASSSKTMVFVSSLKRKTTDILRTLHNYITQEYRINSQVNSLLFKESINENIPIAIPVIWSESDLTEGMAGAVNRECFIPNDVAQHGKQAITENINVFCLDPSRAEWCDAGEAEKKSLNREFNAIAEKHYSNAEEKEEQRVYKTMLSLWQKSQMFSLKRSPT